MNEKLTAAPVIDANMNYVAMIDLLDISWYIINTFNNWRNEQGLTDESQRSQYWNRFTTSNRFTDATVGDVINRQRMISRPVLYQGFSTLYGIELMVRSGVDHLAILDSNNKVQSIFTQSMIISLLDQNLAWCSENLKSTKVNNMIPQLTQTLQTVSQNDRTIDAFARMVNNNINGLAVVSERGTLVDTLSVADLRCLGLSTNNFERLYEPVKTFKQLVRQDFPNSTPSTPITVTLDNTFLDVIKAMDDGNIHRIWVVGYNMAGDLVPTYVISQRDLLRFLLFRMGMQTKTIQQA
jgi:CBS domain-containing protein